ncbi:hypothetical protein Tsubulata_012815 [Turnera subulata]|uniref:Wall-associated receptor kinase galacturonan-binding domain-containing protein n=1 Tax=Turnera subulata TaxID=218843 RepID=A0A9Q0FFF1_9ROSI|nr:hypothetical protein Tsubulata_012815 [Turnera subulata]
MQNIPQAAKAGLLDYGNQTCGSLSIPRPFGLAPGRYKDERFKIECNKSSSPPTAFIPSIKAEVLEFSPDMASVTVKGPIKSSANCTAGKRSRSSSSSSTLVNLTGSPFMFSTENRFTAVGCNTLGSITEDATLATGCKSTCSKERGDIWEAGDLRGSNIFFGSSCEAQNCCTASVQPGLQESAGYGIRSAEAGVGIKFQRGH